MTAARSLNKVQLIGNLTRDPDLRYTPQGTPVCSFGMATNRVWVTDKGEKREEADFHRIVAWSKLAEVCAKILAKGRKVFIEGRLSTREWTGSDGVKRQTTEIVASDLIVLDSRRVSGEEEAVPAEVGGAVALAGDVVSPAANDTSGQSVKKSTRKTAADEATDAPEQPAGVAPEEPVTAEEVAGDIPF